MKSNSVCKDERTQIHSVCVMSFVEQRNKGYSQNILFQSQASFHLTCLSGKVCGMGQALPTCTTSILPQTCPTLRLGTPGWAEKVLQVKANWRDTR